VETVISISQSPTSSIDIGEFGINPAHKGNATAFSMAVNDNLFVLLYSSSYRRQGWNKFIQGCRLPSDFDWLPN
jgi:hypothetical protein